MHILLTPHSQQNLAQSTGYLVPHSWQNLIPGVEHSTSLSFFVSFLRGGEKARKTVGPFGSENKSHWFSSTTTTKTTTTTREPKQIHLIIDPSRQDCLPDGLRDLRHKTGLFILSHFPKLCFYQVSWKASAHHHENFKGWVNMVI